MNPNKQKQMNQTSVEVQINKKSLNNILELSERPINEIFSEALKLYEYCQTAEQSGQVVAILGVVSDENGEIVLKDFDLCPPKFLTLN